MRFLPLVILILLTTGPSWAEYRVFRLVIKNDKERTSREVLSTLDPFQYVGYFPIKPDESIDYTDTWRCFDDTSHYADYCPSPRAKKDSN